MGEGHAYDDGGAAERQLVVVAPENVTSHQGERVGLSLWNRPQVGIGAAPGSLQVLRRAEVRSDERLDRDLHWSAALGVEPAIDVQQAVALEHRQAAFGACVAFFRSEPIGVEIRLGAGDQLRQLIEVEPLRL